MALVKREESGFSLLVLGLLALGLASALVAPAAADAQNEKDFQTVVAGARWIKDNMKNPASFELVSATMIGKDAICYEYRGTNSFNAVVLNHRVITNTSNSDDAKAWNKYCAGKSGVDYTSAKFAM